MNKNCYLTYYCCATYELNYLYIHNWALTNNPFPQHGRKNKKNQLLKAFATANPGYENTKL